MLSLIELQNKRIEAKRKRYEKDEMDSYLELVFDNYKQAMEEIKRLETEKNELNKKIKTLSDGVQYYRSIETTLQKALILAEKTSKETKDAAILKAESIERDAHTRAETIIQRAEDEYKSICEKSARLVQQFNQYKLQLQQAANAQLQLITGNEFDIEEPVAEPVATSIANDEPVAESVSFVDDETITYEAATPEVPTEPTVSSDIVLDTSKEELLNADTIDLSNTLDAVQSETATEEATPVVTPVEPVSTPAMAAVKEATIVEPVVATTVAANPVNVETTKEDAVTNVNESESVVTEEKIEPTPSSKAPSLDNVLNEKTEPALGAGGIPTLDSLLQDLNINNKGNQNSDDPFEFLGSIDDDF